MPAGSAQFSTFAAEWLPGWRESSPPASEPHRERTHATDPNPEATGWPLRSPDKTVAFARFVWERKSDSAGPTENSGRDTAYPSLSLTFRL